MQQCGDKFCSNSNIKLDRDVYNCILDKIENYPRWKGYCFFKRNGAGCEVCGGKLIRGSGCGHCVECGWSRCG